MPRRPMHAQQVPHRPYHRHP